MTFKDIHAIREASTEKYTYFLLATAAAAIAFSVQQTSGKAIAWSHLILGCAVVCWGMSFWCGCWRLRKVDNIRVVELIFLQAAERLAPQMDEPRAVKEYEDVKAARNERNEELSQRSTQYWNSQFNLLIWGGVIFVIWHVVEMFIAANVPTIVLTPPGEA
jgi:hypothetical protein